MSIVDLLLVLLGVSAAVATVLAVGSLYHLRSAIRNIDGAFENARAEIQTGLSTITASAREISSEIVAMLDATEERESVARARSNAERRTPFRDPEHGAEPDVKVQFGDALEMIWRETLSPVERAPHDNVPLVSLSIRADGPWRMREGGAARVPRQKRLLMSQRYRDKPWLRHPYLTDRIEVRSRLGATHDAKLVDFFWRNVVLPQGKG